jgi:hypothetical protein
MDNAGNFFRVGVQQESGFAGHQNQRPGFFAYRIVVKIQDLVASKLKDECNYAEGRYGQLVFSGSTPELVLAKFEAMEEMEETLLRWLHRTVGQLEAFPILFNNYGSMPGYPLYVRVQDPAPFRVLTEGLRVVDSLLQSNGCKAAQIFHHPRLAMASKISKPQEMEVLLDFSGRSFREEMVIEELVLEKFSAGQAGVGILCRLMLSPKGLKRSATN